MYDDFDEYENYDFEDIELYEHKRSDKVKWIISFLLIFVLLAGMIGAWVMLLRENEKAPPAENTEQSAVTDGDGGSMDEGAVYPMPREMSFSAAAFAGERVTSSDTQGVEVRIEAYVYPESAANKEVDYILFTRWRKGIALNRLRHFEARNCGFINELPIVSIACGSMGKKKTTLITDMILSQEVMFRQKALQILQNNDMKFPHFPWICFEDELRACMEYGTVCNLGDCLKNLSKRQGWKCMGVWERSPEKQRLHFHGIFHIPDGTMPGQMIDVNDYNFKSHRRRITHQNTYFNERFGRSDFEEIVNDEVLGDAMLYIMKYIEKSGERIVYYGDLPQFFVSDVMENDILCLYGEDGQKFILSDTFGCWDEGEYIGQVSKETIAKLPKVK